MAMELTRAEHAELMECLLDMGELLMKCGAEISRVEDTLSRMAKAYGCARVDVFAITSLICINAQFPNEETLAETRRIYSSGETDFTRLEHLNHISRSCCREPFTIAELRRQLQQVSGEKKSFGMLLLGSVLAAGGFAVFFGGTLWDALAAAFFATGICFLQRRLGNTAISPVGANLLLSLVTGLVIGAVCHFMPAIHLDKILIGDIMLLIPGLAMINSVRNILGGNTISGLLRLTESLIWAMALAVGFMMSFMIIDLL